MGAAVFGVFVPVFAHATLTVTPITWNVVGLDSNAPATGPDTFPVGARVCNSGSQTANAVTATLVFDCPTPVALAALAVSDTS